MVNGVVYVGSDDHNVYALNAAMAPNSGVITTGWSVTSSPTVVNGVVYVGSNDGICMLWTPQLDQKYGTLRLTMQYCLHLPLLMTWSISVMEW